MIMQCSCGGETLDPDTPIGFYALAAPTLIELLNRANKP